MSSAWRSAKSSSALAAAPRINVVMMVLNMVGLRCYEQIVNTVHRRTGSGFLNDVQANFEQRSLNLGQVEIG